MAKQLAFYFDAAACSGCKACQMACKDKHDLAVGLLWRRVYEITGGEWKRQGSTWDPGVFAYNLSMACNHCQKPICQSMCPTGAIFRRSDGIVLIDRETCIGCRYCEWGCPYGAPQYDEESGVMTKCHFCYDLIDEGQAPACVTACPMRALDFGSLTALKKKHPESDHIFPLPDPELTEPSLLIKPHRDAAQAGPENASIANLEEV